MKPFVSVIIPSYNYAHFLPYTLNNVLSQMGVKLDIVVVDDGSEDNTRDIIKPFEGSVNYIYQNNQGVSAARNTGMLHAKGDYFVFLDADDLFSPGTLRMQAHNLLNNPDAQISMCFNQNISSKSPEGPFIDKGCFKIVKKDFFIHFCRNNIAPIHAHMLTRGVALKIGEFDTSLKGVEDYDFWLRCVGAGYKFILAEGGIALYRKHETSASASSAKMHMYECIVNQKVRQMLDNDSYYSAREQGIAWLAYCSKCFDLMSIYRQSNPKVALEMLDFAFSGLKKISEHFIDTLRQGGQADSQLGIYFGLILAGQIEHYIKADSKNREFALKMLFSIFPELRIPMRQRGELFLKISKQLFAYPLYVTDFATWKTAVRGTLA